MSLPNGEQDLIGNLILSASADALGNLQLNLPLPYTLAANATATSNSITVPGQVQVMCLFQTNGTGSVTAELSVQNPANLPTPDDSAVVTTANKTVLMAATPSTGSNLATVRFINSATATAVITSLRLVVLAYFNPDGTTSINKQDWVSLRSGNNVIYGRQNPGGNGVGTFKINT